MKRTVYLVSLWGLLALVGLLSVSCGEGRADEPPAGERIAVLSPGIATILGELGLTPLVVARHGFDDWSDPALPIVGDQSGMNYEALIAARPTTVLIEASAAGPPARLTELASERGFAVVTVPMLSLADLRSATTALGERFGAPHERIDGLVARMDAAWSSSGEDKEAAPRVVVLLSVDPPQVLGPGSAHYQVVEAIGGVGLPREGMAWIPMTVEGLIAMDPDAIVLLRPEGEANASIADLGALDGAPMAAIREGRVLVVTDRWVLLQGVPMIEFANELRRWLDGLPR